MFTRILNSRLPLIIYNPARVFSLKFFESIFRAGGLPVFDTEFMSAHEIIEGIKSLIKADILFGLRLVAPDRSLLSEIRAIDPEKLDSIIISAGVEESYGDSGSISRWFPHVKIILEVRRIDIIEQIKELSPNALIIRGNEAGGRVSNYSSFILMQWYLKNSDLPVFVHGGVGRNTASGMFAAGASGIVLDSQVWLSEESPLSENFRNLMQSLDENDSIEISTDSRHIFRVFAKLGTKIARELKEKAILLSGKDRAAESVFKEIANQITPMDKADAPALQSILYLGQDAFFAKGFYQIASSLKDMITGFFRDTGAQLDMIDSFDPMVEGSPMAMEHGTKLPLIQGPMANVSDSPDFAEKVLEAGALPFFAVGSLPASLAEKMIKGGSEKVSVFGAGLVGIEAFNPAVEKHLEIVRKYKAPFALFAGGIPSQVIDLEKGGTRTYLHTPSISMMENAMKSGCTRFIFEGREAGGHIGSLSSLVLWEAAIAKLKEKDDETLSKLSLVFAGGISTSHASCFISGIASCLAARGVKIGIQVGTAYLFSKEIVETKSIKEQYQTILCEEDETMVIGSSVGLPSRTAPNEFARMMVEKEKEMIKNGEKLEERKKAFEKNNIGSLLIGAKGFLPDFKKMGEEYYTWFDGEEHKKKGNFLSGDSLAFFRNAITLQDIHSAFFRLPESSNALGNEDVKETLYKNLGRLEILTSENRSISDEIAVIGMGCILPDAGDPEELWDNIISRRYSIKEMDDNRIRKDLYYDPDRSSEDRSYTMLAGHIDNFAFDSGKFGYDEEKAGRLSRSQQLLLTTAYQAVKNAGYLDENLLFGSSDPSKKVSVNPEKVAVIIATCLGNELGNELQFKYHFPEVLSMMKKSDAFKSLSEEEKSALAADIQKGMEGRHAGYDPVHGILLNIEASRIARHLGIRGVNYVVDAACASSFAAIEAAAGELLSGECDHVVVGGVNTHLAPESFVGFCKMGALSAKGSFPFDERADGFILGEGAAVFVLKRMKDALRDKDNIIGIIKGIGGSSDGRGKAIAAPNINGQTLALERCFESMNGRVHPDEIGFIEAHGTSTIMGDQAELNTIKRIYAASDSKSESVDTDIESIRRDGITPAKIGISSIKSQIGHLLGGAGAAGLVKALLAVRKGVLPPNADFEKLSHNHDLAGTGLYIIDHAEPWVTTGDRTRKAAVSSYGFGGINYHLVIEEFRSDYSSLKREIFLNPDYDFNDDRIVIAGIGVCLPGGRDTNQLWNTLQSGIKQLSDIPESRFDNSAYAEFDKKSNYNLPIVKAGLIKDFKFNNIKYRMPPSIVRSLERGQLLGLDAADELISTSGLSRFTQSGGVKSNRIGVILGTIQGERQFKNILRVRKSLLAEIVEKSSVSDEETRKRIASELVGIIREREPENNEDTTPGLLSNIISGRIANHFGLNGVNYVVDASCASSVIAIRNAMRGIASKRLDFALAGGVDANLYPAVLMAFKRLGLLSSTEPRFFDSRADGYAMSEGAAIHLLTTMKRAKEAGMEILGELSDCSVKSSAPDHLLAPSEQTFVSTINDCYKKSGIRKREIGYLDLFAFSNILGDMIEKQVVEKCFESALISGSEEQGIFPLYFGNVKTQLGYFKAANPAVALAKMALMNRNRTLLPNFDFDPQYSTLKNPILPGKEYKAPIRFAFNVNGIGGNHCHMIISMLPPAFSGEKRVEAVERIAAPEAEKAVARKAESVKVLDPSRQMLVALLSGQGAQSPGMMKALFEKDPEIRKIMEQGEKIFIESRGYSLLNIMFADNDSRLNLTENTQPAVFLSSAALFSKFKKGEDFDPDFFIGHSVGEYSALFCSGMLEFDDAMKLIIKRSDLMREAAAEYPGRIMVVFGNEKETASLIRESGASWLYITNKNSEKQTAVSGSEQDIDIFCKFLTSRNVVYKKLNLSGAFHTPLFRKAAESLRKYLETISFNKVDFSKVISNVTASPYPQSEAEVKDLLSKQITTPVEFIKSIEYVHNPGNTLYMEIGPKKLLVNLLKNINVEGYTTSVAIDMVKSGDLTDINENSIMISGVSVGLPGKARRVFDSDNFDMILDGKNFIEPLSVEDQQKIVDKNITRILKDPDGNARFVEITGTEDVIHLAGQLGYFSLNEEYGIKAQYDISMSLAIAAGIEALKDAGIPLVMQYKTPSRFKNGKDSRSPSDRAVTELIPDGFALPEEMQEDTGVIVTSLFPGNETLINEMERYLYDKLFLNPFEEFQNIYFYLMENMKDSAMKEKVTDWFFKIRKIKREDLGPYRFDRNYMLSVCPMGSAHLAQIIKAKGPNTHVSSACASTTQAIGIAEDWIKLGRCKRVIVIGGDNATSSAQNQWVGTGFLALGAATAKKRVSEAAKPFDSERSGTILGCGAVGLVIEQASEVHARGMRGQAVILGTHMANSAYHTFNIDVQHMSYEMKKFMVKMEKEHNLNQADYADRLLFMSHETYTPARGGSADAEVTALRTAFGHHLKNVRISNTKGFTGHTLGAAIEDVVMVKALQKRKAPPIANLVHIPDHFKELNFVTSRNQESGTREERSEYGLHLAAGFGSHFAFLFVRRVEEKVEQEIYNRWLKKISSSQKPELKIINNMLCVTGERSTSFSAVANAPAAQKANRAALSAPTYSTPKPQVGIKSVSTAPTAATKPVTQAPVQSVLSPSTGGVIPVITDIIAKQTGYSADMLEPDLDLEADLGIDTVKQVEIFANAASHFGFAVPEDLKLRDLNTIAKLADYISIKTGGHAGAGVTREEYSAAPVSSTKAPSPATPAQSSVESASGSVEVISVITEIIAKQTGYSADMLEPDLDLEADLGIDTVKQVEIFANAASHFGFAVPEDLKLRDLNTIAKLADYINIKTGGHAGAGVTREEYSAAPVSSTKAPSPATLEKSSTESALETGGVVSVITEIIAKQTGYSADMLDQDLDLEADLGIDTVKQVEIFANAASHFGFAVPEDLKLRDLNTIAKLADYISTKTGISAGSGTSPDQYSNNQYSAYQDSATETAGSGASGSYAPTYQPSETGASSASPVQRPASETASASASETGGVISIITEIIAKQTGYSADMLDPDLDLEADLGIDTVKQVEVFANAASHFGFAVPEDLKLRDLNTIAKLSAYVKTKISHSSDNRVEEELSPYNESDSTGDPMEFTDSGRDDDGKEHTKADGASGIGEVKNRYAEAEEISSHEIKRLVPLWRKTALPLTEQWSFKGLVVAVAGEDSHGVTSFIESEGGSVIRVKNGENNRFSQELHGLICITPFDVESFFTLVKSSFDYLSAPGKFIAALSADPNPEFAGICGMMKSLAKEMPETSVKAVEILESQNPLELFMNEIRSEDPRVEISYRAGEKYVLHLEELPYNLSGKDIIRKGDTVLVTGGARGITFEILKALVKEYETDLVILGRSAIDKLNGSYGENEAAIMSRLRQTMKGAKPVEMKKVASRMMSAGESRRNIEALRSAGVNVTYVAVDVTDRNGVKAAVAPFKKIDCVIHAAGVEESMPFERKTVESFEKVFRTKVEGCRNVVEAVRDKGVRFHIGFSSVTAKFGNEGQTDYTAANEMMAYILKNREDLPAIKDGSRNRDSNSGCKIIDWTAWSGAGMATRETVQKVLTERGLKFLPLEAGVKFFIDELKDSLTEEVVITGLDHSFDRDGILRIAPFLDSIEGKSDAPRMKGAENGALKENSECMALLPTLFKRRLDIERDRFLLDHAMDGTPIFLGATGVETMVEAAMKAHLSIHEYGRVTEISNFSIPYGIKLLQNRPKDIIVTAELQTDTIQKGSNGSGACSESGDINIYGCSITSQFVNSAGVAMGEPKLHYKAEIHISKLPENPDTRMTLKSRNGSTVYDASALLSEKGIGKVETGVIYHPQRLFMDGVFRTIENIISFDGRSLITKISDRSRSVFFKDDPCPLFCTDVVLLDGMFQTGGVFEFLTDSFVVLPYRIKSLKFHRRAEKDMECMCITSRVTSDDDTDTFNIDLVDGSGNYLMELDGFQMVKLNRLQDEEQISGRWSKFDCLVSGMAQA